MNFLDGTVYILFLFFFFFILELRTSTCYIYDKHTKYMISYDSLKNFDLPVGEFQ